MSKYLKTEELTARRSGHLEGGLLGWYAVCTTRSLKNGEIYYFSLFNEPLALYRDKSNRAVCIKDYCPHRGASFRGGEIKENEIQCPYHGARFASEGSSKKLVNIACQHIVDLNYKNFAKNTYLYQYLCEEKDGYIYVYYTGKATTHLEEIEVKTPLDSISISSQGFNCSDHVYEEAILDFQCDWDRIIENHLDILHIFWMHGKSLPGNEVSRQTIRMFDQKLIVNKDFIKTTYYHKDKAKGEFISQYYLPPGRIVMYRGSDSPGSARYVQVLDHIPLSKNQARVIVRHYRKFIKNPIISKIVLFKPLQMKTFYKIFSEDYLVLKTQTFSAQMGYLNKDSTRLLGEDRALKLFWDWHQRSIDKDAPWDIHPLKENVNTIHQNLLMVYPPENRRLIHKTNRILFMRILLRLAVVIMFAAFIYILIG